MDPAWVATGLKVELGTLVNECKSISCRICEIIFLDGEHDQKMSSCTTVPNEFFEDMESSWKGRVKRIHLEEEYAEVDEAAKALSVTTDDLKGRVHAHRLKEGTQNASFLYFLVPGKSMACQLETLLINQLSTRGFHLTNIVDGKHLGHLSYWERK